jgi:ssDNA-binding Zn-finger/Zn-ribbon topoisomerase 1
MGFSICPVCHKPFPLEPGTELMVRITTRKEYFWVDGCYEPEDSKVYEGAQIAEFDELIIRCPNCYAKEVEQVPDGIIFGGH